MATGKTLAWYAAKAQRDPYEFPLAEGEVIYVPQPTMNREREAQAALRAAGEDTYGALFAGLRVYVGEENAKRIEEAYSELPGAVLAAGYPRTDPLVNADATQVRRDVLARLGVPEDRTVVLYAPTYRDTLTTKVYTARRFDDLDLDELTRSLGPQYVVLVRGHNNNQREADRVARNASIVDVTDYPDINDLTLAADVAVLDYSSLRFDWAITGKPMVFFVPDIDSYFSLRAPLFPYEESAPGPWARTTTEVGDLLADHEGVGRRYAEELRAFNERFNRLNDGRATERVLATFLDETRPWRA